ncbi:MAG TPA: Ig-like domain repeat protein [Solirubrobacterales bacterium]|nr:Ig-like domain repeat protein [Solirubrobacterales bacterium]
MFKKLMAAVLAVLCIASLIAASGASAAESEDTTPPEIVGLSFSPKEVDVTESSAEVTVTAHLEDDLSGATEIYMAFSRPGSSQQVYAFPTLIEGTTRDGVFRGSTTIPRFAQAGEWQIDWVHLRDAAGNRGELGVQQLKEAGLPYSFEVREREFEEEPVESAPPQLSEISFEPSEINVTENEAAVLVDAHIKAEAGLKQGYVVFRSPSGEGQQMEYFERLSGTEFDGEYEAKVLFPQGAEAGKWRAEVWLGDHAGHESRIGPEGLDERGLPSSVFVVDGAEEPILEANELLFSPSEIDTSETEVGVGVFAHIDAEAGFASGYASFRSPSGESTIVAPLELEAGTEFSGAYNGVAAFPQGSEPGEWFAELHLSDSAGHEVVLGPEQLNERGMPYEVTVLKPTPPPVVDGISPSSGPESGGTPVHLVGSGFGGVTAVHFGEHLAEFVYESPESITAYAPPGTGNVGVAVTTPGGISGEVNYAYTPSAAVSLSSSPNPSVHGQKVTFTSIVEPAVKGGSTPLGTVTFREGTTTLGVANLSKGKATLSTTTLGAGGHPVVAEYSGDSHYGTAVSSSLTQVVAKATTEVTLTSSLNPAPFGSSGTLKAHVAAVAPGAGTPAGTVTFREGETVLGTVQLSGGNASLSLKSLAPGEHAITAAYSGDANDKASEAAPVKQAVVKSSTELALISTLNPAPFGSSATLKATVKAVTPGGGTPSGTVTFREGETVLASVPLSAGTAKYALKTMAPGEHEITATYSGEADYESSSGGIAQAIVVASTELTLTSSKNPAPHGSTGTLKATVKTIAPGGGTPAGTVTFREGETVLAIIPLSSGSATYPLKSLSIGEHKITATYSGNADYGTSESTIGQVITS